MTCSLTLLTLLSLRAPLFGQQPEARTLTLEAAVQEALKNYPAVQAARAQADAAGAGIDLSRTAYLPKLDLLWQENQATRNNVFGLLLPQSTIPPISGPALGSTSMTGTSGSAGGMLLSWEPFDFGFRKANVDLARALKDRADAGASLTQLDVAASTADLFLAVLAAERAVAAAQANVERMEVFARSVEALVQNQLRPGADASRAQAELAVARNQLIQAQQNLETTRITLSESMGLVGVNLQADPGDLLQLPPEVPPAPQKLESHPLALSQLAALEAARSREHALSKSYFPRFNYQFALFGRGSGALLDGRFDSSRGLAPDVANWATGLTITFPTFDIFGIRARRRVEAYNETTERARYDQILLGLKAQDARAKVLLNATRRIAQNTPAQLQAARETEARARVRYDTGLGTIVEVAEAQRLLAQAETDDAVARLNVWRALVVEARANGDLKPVLETAGRARSPLTP